MVAKRQDSRYLLGERGTDSMKIKNWRESTCVILGYRHSEPGIILGMDDGQRIRSVGIAEFGITPTERTALIRIGRGLEQKRSKDAVWLEPVLKCIVKHVGVSSKGYLRDAYFQRFAI
jgi:DNA ligase-1